VYPREHSELGRIDLPIRWRAGRGFDCCQLTGEVPLGLYREGFVLDESPEVERCKIVEGLRAKVCPGGCLCERCISLGFGCDESGYQLCSVPLDGESRDNRTGCDVRVSGFA